MPSLQFLRALGLLFVAAAFNWFTFVLIEDYRHAPIIGWVFVGIIFAPGLIAGFIAGIDLAECWADTPQRRERV